LEPLSITPNEKETMMWYKFGDKSYYNYRLAEWSFGMLNNFPPYDAIWPQRKTLIEILHKVSILSIKKTIGKKGPYFSDIREPIDRDFKYLHSEFDIIDPDVVISFFEWSSMRQRFFPNMVTTGSGYFNPIGRHKKAKIIDLNAKLLDIDPEASYSLLQNIVNSFPFKYL
jgi:hypothetical protein